MPSKRGVSKKVNHAKFFTSPRRIDKRSRRTNKGAGWGLHRSELRNSYDRPDTKRQIRHKQHTIQKSQERKALTVKSTNRILQQKRQEFKKSHLQQRKREGKENAVVSTPTPAPAPAPAPSPTPAPVQLENNVRLFALGHFHQLLQVVVPGSLVVLDIDETLIITRNMPSLLLDSSGVITFQKHIQQAFPDFTSRNLYCRRLQQAIKDKSLVEDQTANTIRGLQARGCRVFALTARYAELAERTERVLGNVGISFAESAPFPKQPIQDPVTEAVVMNGIVYCNGEDKGRILSRLLSSVIFPREKKEQASGAEVPPIAGIHFVDDRLEHTLSVRNALQAFPSLKIPSICFHYRSPITLQQEAQQDLAANNPALLPFIMDYFIAHNRVLSNNMALELLENNTSCAEASGAQE